jgi:putative ubiquitin-RnfH superfamily antitoxin RatB of RatAB toxin-antitoxin module
MAEINVQVCFALPNHQSLRTLSMPEGSTLLEAIRQSGLLRDEPLLDLATCKVGIYGKLHEMDTVLRDRDRVEIYRPLIADPKESRRKRAEKKGQKKAC